MEPRVIERFGFKPVYWSLVRLSRSGYWPYLKLFYFNKSNFLCIFKCSLFGNELLNMQACVCFWWSYLKTTHARTHTHSCIYFNDYTFIWMHVVCLFRSVCISIKAGAEWECMVWVWRTKIHMLMHMYRQGALQS